MILQLTFWKALRAGAVLILAAFAAAEKVGPGFEVAGMALVAILAGILAGRGLPRVPRRSALWGLLLLEAISLPSLLQNQSILAAPIIIAAFALAFYCGYRTANRGTALRTAP